MKAAGTSYTNRFILLFTAIVTVLLLQACTLDGLSGTDGQEEVTEADLEAASQILGESLSDENDGVMASLNDALTTVSSTGFEKAPVTSSESPTVQSHDNDSNSGRGAERNFSYRYDPATGTHTIIFTRIVHAGEYFKSVKDTLKYIFTDNNNQFVAFPRANQERIETIDYKGSREGIIESAFRESQFTRRDTFFIEGVSDASALLEVDGVHHGSGSISSRDSEGNPFQRNYTTQINFLDIDIDKGLVEEYGTLEQGVTGTLSWEIEITFQSNGNSGTKTISGTIEMNGDGTALLRFERFAKLFLINLDDGEVMDHSREFGGRVKHVNREQGTFTLSNGGVVQITENTQIDPESDLHSLVEVARALERGALVYAEGAGTIREELFAASELKFEVDENNGEHVEGVVTDINLETRIITIGEELTIRMGEDSIISGSSELGSLEAAKEYLLAGKEIHIAGFGLRNAGSDAILLAVEIKFEVEEEGEKGFEGTVTSVNAADNSLTLGGDLVLRIGENSIISAGGDLRSLAEVAEALELGHSVIGFGGAVADQETAADLLIIEVKFLILD